MKFRKIAMLSLTLALAGTMATALAACGDGSKKDPAQPDEEYTFQDGRPDGDLAAPDEGFTIDGKLDEAAYSNLTWLEGYVMRPYYTNDGQGIYYDYDVIQEKMQQSAQVKMGTYYGTNGIYIAYSFQEQPGKVCYVNPARKSYRNSGVELHIGVPASLSMTGDETISRLTVNANGALTVTKTQGETWVPLYGTEDPANMPYVGLTGNGTRTDEAADRTQFTFELFIPWGYFDEACGEGTAQSMKDGGDLVIGPSVITANNYTGTGQTDREWYMISSRLDDGEWGDPQGWYHFNGSGYCGYKLTVKEAQNGAVQEWMGYTTAAKNSSVTFVTKANEGYALKEFRVNGTPISRDYIHYDMYTGLGAEAEKSVQKAYIRIPQKFITGDTEVEAVFEPLASGEQTLSATIYGGSTENALAETEVTFTRGDKRISGKTDGQGKLNVSGLTAGFYEVTVGDVAYRGFHDYIFFSPAAHAQIVFAENAIPLEGRENTASNYTEIFGEIGSVKGGFVLSGFFGFEGAEYDELVNFTNTVYFITKKSPTEQYGFRFTKWGSYLMLKCEGAEFHFDTQENADHKEAMEYLKKKKGVYFKFAVDAEGDISVYLRKNDTEWIQLSGSAPRFPIEKEIKSIEFGKQDDGNAKCYATLVGGTLSVGTSRLEDIPVSVTVNNEAFTDSTIEAEGGTITFPESIVYGDEVTVTFTPEKYYGVTTFTVNGTACEVTKGENGTYTATFKVVSQQCEIVAVFGKNSALFTLNVTQSGVSAADDLEITLDGVALTRGSGDRWTLDEITFGSHTLLVRAKAGDYTVLKKTIDFRDGSPAESVTVNADNYGTNRKYTLKGETASTDGIVLVEDIGATTGGFVFEGSLGVGGAGDLSSVEGKNFASAIRFTTESGYRYVLSFYVFTWNGATTWYIRCYNFVNDSPRYEYTITDEDAKSYITTQKKVNVRIVADTSRNITVCIEASAGEWVSLGTQATQLPTEEKIEKVEFMRVFQANIGGWTATVDGTLKFGTTGTGIPVNVTGAEDTTQGTVSVENANLGEEITITITPKSGYDLSAFKVDGETKACTDNGDGTYTCTFTAEKNSYAVEAVFEEVGTLTLNITDNASAGDDLKVTLTNALGSEVALTKGSGNYTTTEQVVYGTYTVTVTSKSGGYTVLKEAHEFTKQAASFAITIDADNYGDQRKYELSAEVDRGASITLAENLGKTDSFVFTGFMGARGTQLQINAGLEFDPTTTLEFASGGKLSMQFITWSNNTQQVKIAYKENGSAGEQNREFRTTLLCAPDVYEAMKRDKGVSFMIVMDSGKFRVYAKSVDDVWVQLHIGSTDHPSCPAAKSEWDIGSSFANQTITRVTFSNPTDNTDENAGAKLVNGELRFGTTDTGIDVNVVGAGDTAQGKVEASTTNLGEELTITLTPESGYELHSLTVDGERVAWTGDSGTSTYTVGKATKSSYTVEAVFGEVKTLSVTLDVSALAGQAALDDFTVTLMSLADGTSYSVTKSDSTWTTQEQLPKGEYRVCIVYKAADTDGYTVYDRAVDFTQSEGVTISLTDEHFGAQRKYVLEGRTPLASLPETASSIVLAEDLGTITDGFVLEGFFGFDGRTVDEIERIRTEGTEDSFYSIGTDLAFTFEGGKVLHVRFFIWRSTTWVIKIFEGTNENNNYELGFYGTAALADYVRAQNGITISLATNLEGTLVVYAKTGEDAWMLLGAKDDFPTKFGLDFTKKLEKVELTCTGYAYESNAIFEGELRFGTTAAPVTAQYTNNGATGSLSALHGTIDLDEKGTKYWEHYSSGTGGNNSGTVTDEKANATDVITFDPSGWDRYETRPYTADNAQAFTGTSQNGELNSKGFVFRDHLNALTATITLSKGDTAIKVYTGTWISNCQFTLTLTEKDTQTEVGKIVFNVINGSATYEAVFSIDTSSWSENESKEFTLSCGSNNTLKLMAIAIA